MSNTPRCDHILQHGLFMTGKDELCYLAKDLERENTILRSTNDALLSALKAMVHMYSHYDQMSNGDAIIANARAAIAAAESN